MVKKFILVLCFLFLFAGSASAATAQAAVDQFQDINGHWAAADLKEMVQLGILNGVPAGSGTSSRLAQPDRNITRAEFAAFLAQTLNLSGEAANPAFADWADVPQWAKNSVALLYQHKITAGYANGDGTYSFRPNQFITRAEITAMVVKALDTPAATPTSYPFTDIDAGDWYYQPVLQAMKLGLVVGKDSPDTFKPADPATRAEVLVILHRFLLNDCSQAPADSDLVNAAKNYDQLVGQVLQGTKKVSDLQALTTGGAALDLTQGGGLGLLETGSAAITGAGLQVSQGPAVTVKSDRLARVSQTLTATVPAGNQKVTVQVTEELALTKVDGQWLVYEENILSSKTATN